ncbi:MAG TPA: zf-TFIIB domain-containing protein [Labilithrix sp.]|nr:zf-TFIIB domain-containing protein [Labilithrix sp.]
MEKPCPSCGGRMIDGPDSRGAWACIECGGVWTGKGLSKQVSSVLDPNVRELAETAQTNAELRRAPRPLPIPRACPECRVSLEERVIGGVRVDVCAKHGTWFDIGELQALADFRTAKAPAHTASRPSPPRSSDALDVTFSALGLLFTILDD